MKEAEFKKFMKATLGDIWVDGGSLNDPIMNNNKRILNESINSKRKQVSDKRKK